MRNNHFKELLICCSCLLTQLAVAGSGHAVEHHDDHADSAHPEVAKEHSEHPETIEDSVHGEDGRKAWHGVSLIEKASFFSQQQDYILAERAYIQVLESNHSVEDKQKALIGLAEVYHSRGVVSKAVDTLENYMRAYPESEDRPEVQFRLGQLYQEMDLNDESIAMFYKVLNSIVVNGESSLSRYLELARLAQFQIARGHFEQGEYERAYLLFDRIELLKLSPTDRETVLYYKILATVKAGHHEDELALLRQFETEYPNSEFLPEIIYLEAEALYRMKRIKDSEEALMRLLGMVGPPHKDTSETSLYWRQQAGNRLANRFYDDGNFLIALRIYQGMVSLDTKPAWQLPLIYQIGLCFEKLSMYDRATESYLYINKELETVIPEVDPPVLLSLANSVKWRLDLLSWRDELGDKASRLSVGMPSIDKTIEPET